MQLHESIRGGCSTSRGSGGIITQGGGGGAGREQGWQCWQCLKTQAEKGKRAWWPARVVAAQGVTTG